MPCSSPYFAPHERPQIPGPCSNPTGCIAEGRRDLRARSAATVAPEDHDRRLALADDSDGHMLVLQRLLKHSGTNLGQNHEVVDHVVDIAARLMKRSDHSASDTQTHVKTFEQHVDTVTYPLRAISCSASMTFLAVFASNPLVFEKCQCNFRLIDLTDILVHPRSRRQGR